VKKNHKKLLQFVGESVV